jgi:hypothetical protein
MTNAAAPITPELKPCPFCGGPAQKPDNDAKAAQRPRWSISCYQYCFSIHRKTREEVIAAWNTRADHAERVAALEAENKRLREVSKAALFLIEQEREVLERSFLPNPDDAEQHILTQYEDVTRQINAALKEGAHGSIER